MSNRDLSELAVVDVGASGGLCEPFASEKNIVAILFDPDMRAPLPTEEEQCYGRAITFPVALAKAEQTVRFYLAKDQECSSCLEPNLPIINRYVYPERFHITKGIDLQTQSLDHCLQSENIDPDFIKIDVQGFEYDVLEGAKHSLKAACGLLLETEFEPLYTNQKLFPEIHHLLRASGFELFDLQRCYYKRRLLGRPEQKGQLLFGNALYLRPPEKLSGWRADKLKAMMRIYEMFGFFDCYEVARELLNMCDLPSIDIRSEPPMTFVRRKVYGLIGRVINILQKVNASILWREPFGSSDKPFSNL